MSSSSKPPVSESDLKVVIVDADAARAAILEQGLRGAGLTRVTIIPETVDLLARLLLLDPDVIVIDLENPSRDVLEQMFHVSRLIARPVAMFVDQADMAAMESAIDAGVSAYVVAGLSAERVKSIIDVAILRFRAFDRLQKELEEARGELADRKTIDRAKRILMKAKSIEEDEAYALIRRTAMNEKKKIIDIAHAVLIAADMLK